MARPSLTKLRITRMGPDGSEQVGVEYQFGDTFHDTLWEDWPSQSDVAQRVEMNRRYDNWLTHMTTQQDVSLEQQLVDAERAAHEAQRAALDAQQRIYDLHDQIAAEATIIED